MAEAEAIEWVVPTENGYWSMEVGREMVESWRRSGEPLASFAKRHGLAVRRVKYWVDRVGGSSDRARPAARRKRGGDVAFAPVRVVDAGQREVRGSESLEVVIGAVVVRVPPGFDGAHLRRVVVALGGGA